MVTVRDALAAAVGHHQAGRLDEARPLYLSILQAIPGHPDALHLLGVLESQRGLPRRAVLLLRRAVALRPDDGDVAGNLGLALRAVGDSAGAVRALGRALALDPGQVQAAYNLGNLLLADGDAAGAVGRYRQALARHARFPEAWNNLGTALLALGRAGEAAQAFAEALALRPEDVEARINRANALATLGRPDAAARLRRQAAALAPAQADALHNAAVSALAEAGLDRTVTHHSRLDDARIARAVRTLGHALAADPRHAAAGDALVGAALALLQAGRADDALLERAARAALAALRRNPRDSRAAALVAYRLHRRGRLDLAARFMARFSRRFTPAELAEDFELRLWSMVRAERGFLDGIPPADEQLSAFAPLEVLFDAPAGPGEGDRPILALSCDDGYYRRFAGALLESAAVPHGPAVHVHVINPSPETEADLAAWRARLPLGASRERVDFTGWDDHRRITYYACIRFLRWHQLLGRLGRPLAHVDADCTLTECTLTECTGAGGLGALEEAMAGFDVGLLRDGRGRGPTRDITVCFAWFQPTPHGRAYLERTAAYIAWFLRRGRGYWMLDQAAPACVLDALERRGEGPRVRAFDVLDFPWVRFIGEK
ncbi:tetratricopeptide repeat protein [Azospirillum rugosum]|uniref:Tetratricopeptide (TPR) repeat protein n=1 Tax=Azospirillum rugosum TaxID=416170 RepID=A0ABS4SHI2_9PROT|nr:tetratricopeptide repeat protein [Azospirillum rugosum]MBP2291649.1 tetratricopeptide (TPR) repeat protein [Azospirillum rugosum]MDQ0524539.1 tetratricopeptide (TPR) repeat protein [Azospirillum rugosum]